MVAINQWLDQQTEYLSYYFNTYSDIREDFIIMKVKQFILDMKNMIGLALRLGAKEGEEMQKFYFPTYFLIFDISPEKRELKTTEEFFNAGKEHGLELGEDKADRKLTEKEKKSRKKTPGKE